MKAVLLILSLAAFSFALPCSKTPPTWPNVYSVKGSINIPYTELHEPFEAWFDAEEGNSRIDYYGGTSKNFQYKNYPNANGSTIIVVPITTEKYTNKITCVQENGSGGVAPQTVLPDMSSFTCVGKGWVNGIHAQQWTYTQKDEDKVNQYIMWIKWKVDAKTKKSVAVPVYYEMKGYDSLIGSHFDHYYINYHNYVPRKPSKAVWHLPQTMQCGGFPNEESKHFGMVNPIKEYIHGYEGHIEGAWQDFIATHKKQYSNSSDHATRRHIFKQNHRLVYSHNRAGKSYKLALNHFADWTQEEMRVLRGQKSSTTRIAGSSFPYDDQELTVLAASLPDNFDWRIYGAVNPVKDQSICGSCWSFGTTGTVEGAYFLKTKTLVSLSEQALVDCSWGFGNDGCDGGNDYMSYQWIQKHGGLPLEAEYGPYLAIDGRCHVKGMKLTANITGWVDVKTLDANALKVAIFEKGPISIAIDAAVTTFSFYSNGVYDDPSCKGGVNDLDHAVLAVGYGVLDGKNYWLVKNSWSTWWGNDGYILIAVEGNICGVMTAPTYVTM